jgi:hypothetical protein
MIQGNFFALGVLFSMLRIRGCENLFFLWPHFEFLSFVLGVLSMFKIKIFYYWPPTLDAKSRRPKTKKLLQFCACKFGHGMFRAIFFLSVSYFRN